ncbi:hypothetical protein R4849_11230 [Acinetobacter baumannii]|nr:hypothetical protein [Acinetobacter baumannii]HEI8440635.1 hypothetical protein [Acinetobacter baumannii]
MNTKDLIAVTLSKIGLLIEKTRSIHNYFHNKNEISLEGIELDKKREDAYSILINFTKDFNRFSDFIGPQDLEMINEKVTKVEKLIELIYENISLSTGSNRKNIDELLTTSLNLPVIDSLIFYNTGYITPKSLRDLIKTLEPNLLNINNKNIDIILNSSSHSEYIQLIDNILKLKNINSIAIGINEQTRIVVLIHEIINNIETRLRKLDASESIKELEDKAIEIKEQVSLTSNSNLIDAFKLEASVHNKEIKEYNSLILTIFVLIIFFLSLLIILVTFTTLFNHIYKFQFYGFYFSFFIFLSALLTYLIRERKRLLNHQHYCRITYLELLALAPYTAQILDKTKRDELIVQLGERYFQGLNPAIKNEETASNLPTEKLSEIIKLVQEVKSTVSKS